MESTALVNVLLATIAFLLAAFIGLGKMFVNRLFKKIEDLEEIFRGGMDERRHTEGLIFEKVNGYGERITAVETKCEFYHSKVGT